MAPTWLTAVAWTALAVAVASAAVIVFDIYGRGYRQRHMPVMEAVRPITRALPRPGRGPGLSPLRPDW